MPPILKEVPVSSIIIDDKRNGRGTEIGTFNIPELAEDIQLNGLIQHPVVVTDGNKYRVIAGFRRMHAIKYLKWQTVHVVVNDDFDTVEKQIGVNLAENIQRQTINIVQEARTIQFLMDRGKTVEEMTQICNRSKRWVEIRRNLMKLPPEVHVAVAAGAIDTGQIQQLFSVQEHIGEATVLLKLKAMQEARQRGQRLTIGESSKLNTKRHRKRDDIFEMQDVIRQYLGNGVETRLLAWAGGEISTAELLQTLEATCRARGIQYTPPTKVP